MFNYAALMPSQSRPKGPMWPVDDAWKRGVLTDMKKAGIGRSEMSRRIGCKPSALTVLFRAKTKQSRLVPGIHRELGRPAPTTVTTPDETLRRINTRWPSLTAEQRALIDSLVGEFAANGRR